jgi:transcriptional regulator with XRE-family HTH domain
MDEGLKLPPTVSLDGDSVKEIREAGSLTQLYIAEVVGVSVDTVSRWENNRTAAVKRENALALAEALEVEVGRIIRSAAPADEGDAERAASQLKETKRISPPVIALLIVVIAALFWALTYTAAPEPSVKAVRLLPPYTPPGSEVPIAIDLFTGSDEPVRLVLRETLPPGWTLAGAVPSADQSPGEDGVMKWILNVKGGSARVVYLAKTPTDAAESTAHIFKGEVVTADRGRDKGREGLPLGGEARIDLEYLHWADEDADFTIDDSEVLRALERLESAKELGLETKDIRRLWGVGEYSWNPLVKKFAPRP